MKLVVDQHLGHGMEQQYNAISKARTDVFDILAQEGFAKQIMYRTLYRKFPQWTTILVWIDYLRFILNVGKQNTIVFQYPVNCHPKKLLFFFQQLRKRQNKIILLVHDIDAIRLKNGWMDYERDLLNNVDKIILHTPSMISYMKEEGVKTPMTPLLLFDYLTTDELPPEKEMIERKNSIAFAGNLKKSTFIASLLSCRFDHLRWKYYGLPTELPFDGVSHRYEGKFAPEKVATVKAGWGLVWDGDSIESCTGLMGNYLRYNASHKLSLYLAAGIPVIVWRGSGVAAWVEEQKVGVAIERISDLEALIGGMEESTYMNFVKHARQMAGQLRNGYFLKQAIKE